MDERILKWLHDVQQATSEIDSFFEGKDMTFIDYQKEIMLKRAVERNLEIIGEAINRIFKRDYEFTQKISETKAIIGLRNQVIHAYDNISDEIIWSVLKFHLPKLKAEVLHLIASEEE